MSRPVPAPSSDRVPRRAARIGAGLDAALLQRCARGEEAASGAEHQNKAAGFGHDHKTEIWPEESDI